MYNSNQYTPQYQSSSSMYGNKNMKIMKFIVQESGTYNQQWKRPFTSEMNGQTFNSLLETISSVKSIQPSAMTGIANQFLHPTANPESSILIPNGWQERRLRFFLEVQTESQIGAIQTEYIIGYTDYAGLSANMNIDPQMRFFINSVNVTRTSYQNTVLGNQVYQNVIDSSHVLINDQYTGIHTGNKVYTLRPEEVFVQMDSADIAQEVGTDDFFDTQIQLTRSPIKSKRANSIAPVYVSNVLDSYLKTKMSDNQGGSKTDILESAKAVVKSDSVSTDPFISYIRNKGDGLGNSFTYGDLVNIDPSIVHKTVTLGLTNTTRASVHSAGSSANWASSTGETVFATCIAQSIPGYMLDHCINNIRFRATNNSLGSKINIIVDDVKSFMRGIDITQYVQSLCFKLENELLLDLSYNNQMGFSLEVVCDLLGETWINLSLNSSPFTMYVTPSFCDALMSPMTTNNLNNLSTIASDFSNLLDQIGDTNPHFATLPGNFGNI